MYRKDNIIYNGRLLGICEGPTYITVFQFYWWFGVGETRIHRGTRSLACHNYVKQKIMNSNLFLILGLINNDPPKGLDK